MEPTAIAALIKDGGLFAVAVMAIVFAILEHKRANKAQDRLDDEQKANIATLLKATVAMEAVTESSKSVIEVLGKVSDNQREIMILWRNDRGDR